MDVQFVCPEGSDLTVLKKHYPDLYHDDTNDGFEFWWIGQDGEEYWSSEKQAYNYGEDDEGPFQDERDTDKEWMTLEDATEFCGFAEALIEGSETMLEGNGGWAQGKLRDEPEYLKGQARAESILQNTEAQTLP